MLQLMISQVIEDTTDEDKFTLRASSLSDAFKDWSVGSASIFAIFAPKEFYCEEIGYIDVLLSISWTKSLTLGRSRSENVPYIESI